MKRSGAEVPITVALSACIFDVDGVLLASPHERAWRDALRGFANPDRFTTAMYQAAVAGKPRLDGALAALEALGVDGAREKSVAYAARKQERLEELIAAGSVVAFPDALRFVEALHDAGWPMGVASSSKNANGMMEPMRLPSGLLLLTAFAANLCGRDVPHGKPDPAIFLLAATELDVPPDRCCVIEDAPAGIEAAVRGRMTGLGVARLDDARSLADAGARLVVTTLDDVATGAFTAGRLERASR